MPKLKIKKYKMPTVEESVEEGDALPESKAKLKFRAMPIGGTDYYKSQTPQKSNIMDERGQTDSLGRQLAKKKAREEYERMLKRGK